MKREADVLPSTMQARFPASLVVAVLLFWLDGCSPTVNVDPETVLATNVEQFHIAYNAKRFDDIYDGSFSVYRARHSRAEHRELMANFYNSDGQFIYTNQFGTNVIETKDGYMVVGVYTSMFEHGFFSEDFAFNYYRRNGRVELMRYIRTDDNLAPKVDSSLPQGNGL